MKNKTTLLEYKKDIQVIKNGEEILEQKRNILLSEIIKILDEVEIKRENLNELVLKSYRLLIKGYMESDREDIEKKAKLINFEGEFEVIEKSFIGVVIPEISFKIPKNGFPINATDESLFLDFAKESFDHCLQLILELAQIEIKAWKLSNELKKTVVRVNALTKHYIPNYQKNIKEIETSLEETEREFLIIQSRLTSKSVDL